MINLKWFKSIKYYVTRKTGSGALALLVVVMVTVAATGFLAAAIVGFIAVVGSGILSEQICFSEKCIKNASDVWQYPFYVLCATLNLLVSIATIGGIFVALLGYLHTTAATAFGNHISQLEVFQKYLESEISKRSRVSPRSVDIYRWYNLIFPDSDTGTLNVSLGYEGIVESLTSVIENGNSQSKSAVKGSFRFVSHQENMIKALSLFGIKLDRQPRVEFFEIEDEILSLIRAVNFAFCGKSSRCIIPDRNYR